MYAVSLDVSSPFTAGIGRAGPGLIFLDTFEEGMGEPQ